MPFNEILGLIVIPRQARDKHRETVKKRAAFSYRIFILLAKRTVTGGRATAVLPTDIGE
jgi:hypothetical protein